MDINKKMEIALTFDDAPSIKEKNISYSPKRMDIVLDILKKHNIQHCTAFVIGNNAVGHEDKLRRWLDAGYLLGNHTYGHEQCSKLSTVDFEKTVLNCHKVLESVGALSKSEEIWFRFPYLDYGKDSSQRKAYQAILHDMGYKVAHASISFYDNQYEQVLESAILSEADHDIKCIRERYLTNISNNVDFMKSMYSKQFNADFKHIAYSHFGCVSEFLLDQMLERLQQQGIKWCDLSTAANCKTYAEFESDYSLNGLVLELMAINSLPLKVKRKLSRLSKKWKLFRQHKYGPIWPYLQ